MNSLTEVLQRSKGMSTSAQTTLAEGNINIYNMVDVDRQANKAKAVNVKAEVCDDSACLPIEAKKFKDIAARWANFGKRQKVVPSKEEEKQDLLHAKRLPVEPKYIGVLEKFDRVKFTKTMAVKHRDDLDLLDDAKKNIRYHRRKEQQAAATVLSGGGGASVPQPLFKNHSSALLQREAQLATLFEQLKQNEQQVQANEEVVEAAAESIYENEFR